MSNTWRNPRKYRQPNRKEQNKIFFTGYRLDELFDEEELADFMAEARQRAIGEFYFATEVNPRYRSGCGMKLRRGTDNYIIGLSSRPSELARHVLKKTHRAFITGRHLPSTFADLHPKLVERIVWQAQYDVLVLTVDTMRQHGEIWYDRGLGIWQVCQSDVDEFRSYREFRKAAKHALKVDDRNYHGRVRSQSKNRGVPGGVSVSYA